MGTLKDHLKLVIPTNKIQNLTTMACFPELTEEEMRAFFDESDTDNSGAIDRTELANVIARFQIPQTEEVITEMLNDIDDSGSETVDFPEFLTIVTALMAAVQAELDKALDESLLEAFKSFDLNGDGTITKDELKESIAAAYGETKTDEEIDEMIGEVDTDGDGKVNYEEFVAKTKKDIAEDSCSEED